MFFGVLSGFGAAIFNSAGYLFSSWFLLHYRDPVRLLFMAQFAMLVITLPFMLILVPFAGLRPVIPQVLGYGLLFCLVFLVGQGASFVALRYFDASRLASLLGLKIIVLTVIFLLTGGEKLQAAQLAAVVMATAAAMIFNWSGSGRSSIRGWLFLLLTLVCYSIADLAETRMVLLIHETCGFSISRSAFAAVSLLYVMQGAVSLPGLLYRRPSTGQLLRVTPYAVLWLCAQTTKYICFALVQPVFGNVILATRGIFSVLFGVLLPLFGIERLDSRISARKWVQRGAAALLMLAAITVYSSAIFKG